MSPDEFNYVSTLLKSRSGLVLSQDKAYFLESRLMPVARSNDLQSVEELLKKNANVK